MKKFLLLILSFMLPLTALEVNKEDYASALDAVKQMKEELKGFKRASVEYELLLEDKKIVPAEIRAVKKKLLIHKRMYNSFVDDLARLAYKSLLDVVSKPKDLHLSYTQSCGDLTLKDCRSVAISSLKRQAVEQNSASLVDSFTLIEDNTISKDRIKNDFKGAITAFDITNETILEGGIGIVVEADITVEGHLPQSAMRYFMQDKIEWDGEKEIAHYPSVPFISVRTSKNAFDDTLTRWLGLKPRPLQGLFVVTRLAEQYHYVGAAQKASFLVPLTGIKAGYEFKTWRLYSKVFTNVNNSRSSGALSYLGQSVESSDYDYVNITAGIDLFFQHINVGAGAGVGIENYRLFVGTDSIKYDNRGLYSFFDASYRIDLESHFLMDIGVEIAQLIWLSQDRFSTNSTFENSLADISTRSVYAFYVELGYRF